MELKIIEYKNIRVLTTQQIAEAYQADAKQISYNFNHNRDRYQAGKHYILLEGDELKAFRENHDLPSNINKLYLWTEKGAFLHAKSLNTDKAWEVYERLVDFYFHAKQTVEEEFSPQLQILQGILNQMKRKELEDKERDRQIAFAQETAEKAVETTEKIKEEFTNPFENWRDDINRKVRQIAKDSGIPYQQLFSQMYEELERNGYNLAQRQRNKRARMLEAGCKRTDIDRETSKIAVIEEDKKAKRIFGDIVARYAVKYIS